MYFAVATLLLFFTLPFPGICIPVNLQLAKVGNRPIQELNLLRKILLFRKHLSVLRPNFFTLTLKLFMDIDSDETSQLTENISVT